MEEVPESDHRTRGVDRGNSGGGGQNHVLQAWQRQHHHIHSYSLQYGKTPKKYNKLDMLQNIVTVTTFFHSHFLYMYYRCQNCSLIPVSEIT